MARILLVEDDAEQLELRRLLLERGGHQVETAGSIADAIAQAPNAELVVMDLVPGHENFLETLPPSTPVIVLSGRDPVGETAASRGTCLRKPCSSRVLIETIKRVCA